MPAMGRGSGTQAPATASSGGRRMASAAAMERRQAAADCRRSWRWRRRWRHRHGERPGGPRPALCGKRSLGLGSSGFGGGARLECAERAAPSQSGGRVPSGYVAVVGDRPPGAHPPPPEATRAGSHCIALHCTALHCIALRCIALHYCIALHCIALHCIALHCIGAGLASAVK